MINKLIEKQLEKLEIAKPGPYDPIKKQFIIPKYNPLKLEVGNSYILRLKPYITNPPENSTLVTNWNNNTFPVCSIVKAYVSRSLGTMVKIDTCGYDLDNKVELSQTWTGWIKRDDAEIISAL